MIFKNSSGMDIYYEVSGSENDQPVIFLHAWGSSSRDFDYTFEHLEGYLKIRYDHRGFGKSERPNMNISSRHLANDLKEFIEYLSLKDVILVGYSMGASIVYKYIELFGEENIKSVVIIDMTPKLLNDDSWRYGILNGKFEIEDLIEGVKWQFDNMIDFYYDFYIKMDPELLKKPERVVRRAISADLAGNSYYSITAMWYSICTEDFRETVKKITIPTALFFANPGSLVNPEVLEYLEDNIENSKTFIFENCTHGFVNNRPKYFNENLQIYLDSVK